MGGKFSKFRHIRNEMHPKDPKGTKDVRKDARFTYYSCGKYTSERLLNYHLTSLAMRSWLLRRAEGILSLRHCVKLPVVEGLEDLNIKGICTDIDKESSSEGKRDQQIILSTMPWLSGLLLPEASVHLDLTWGMSALLKLSLFPHAGVLRFDRATLCIMKVSPARHYRQSK